MRIGWSCKEAAVILDISTTRVSQSLDPTLDRIAKLWRADPTKTLETILYAVNTMDPMTEREIDMRVRMLNGTLDRSELHPNSKIK